MRKNCGAALIDYLIPTAVIGLIFGLGIYHLASNGSLTRYLEASGKATAIAQDGLMRFGSYSKDYNSPFNTLKPGSLGGTEGQPVRNCSGDYCTVDFGTYIMQGVPNDWNSFVESTGTAGSTSQLAKLLDDIYEEATTEACGQVESPGDCAQTSELKGFIELTRTMAQIQKNVETVAKTCQKNDKPANCLYNTMSNTPVSINLSPESAAILSEYNNSAGLGDFSTDPFQYIYQQYPAFKDNISLYNALSSNQTDVSRSMQLYYPSIFNSRKNSYPSYAMIYAYDQAMKSSALSQSMKDNVTSIFREIDKLNSDLSSKVYAAKMTAQNTPSLANVYYMDPITATTTYTGQATIANDLSDLIKMQSSRSTDLKKMVCGNSCSDKKLE